MKNLIFMFLLAVGLVGCYQGSSKENSYVLNCYDSKSKAYHEPIDVTNDKLMHMASYAIYETLQTGGELALFPDVSSAEALYKMYKNHDGRLTMGVSRHVRLAYSNVYVTYKIAGNTEVDARDEYVSFVVVYTDCGDIDVRY